MSAETSLTIISIALVILVTIAVYALFEIGRTLKNLNETLKVVNTYLPNILANIEETAIRINDATMNVSRKIEALAIGASTLKSVLSIRKGLHQQGWLGIALAIIGGLPPLKATLKGVKAFFGEYRAKK